MSWATAVAGVWRGGHRLRKDGREKHRQRCLLHSADAGPAPAPARPPSQRDLEAARLEVAHLSASARRLEAELEAAQKRVRGLTDDLEEARAPFEADQGEPPWPLGTGLPRRGCSAGCCAAGCAVLHG